MIYRAITTLVGPLADATGRLAGDGWRQRLALSPPMMADGAMVGAMGGAWLHGASVGELTSAQVVVRALAQRMPLVVTANTDSGRALAAGWGLAAQLAPLDLPGAVDRFLDRHRPAVAITVENEIWPNRAAALRRRAIPQVVIGARMSARSAARWGRLRGVIGPVLAGLHALSAQDAATEARLVALGLPPDALLPRLQLKLLGPAQVEPPPDSAARDVTLLAASTHEGEDEIVLDAFVAARRQVPGLRLILAPRHPRRGDAVAGLVAARGLACGRRSAGADAPDPVLLVDRLGEMPRWYAAAGLCLTGGSLVNRGGHTPWEPAAFRCAILHGPHVANAADDYALLDRAAGAVAVTAGDLGARIAALAADPDAARAMGRRARQALREGAGDPAPLIDAIAALAGAGRA